ncbi:hypothetical protein [Photobacterium jeanii]|nr:hypothetical protein [Photobacterium jeanii]
MGKDKLDVEFVRDLINDIECCDYQPVELHIEHVGKILLPKEYSAVVDAYKKHYDLMTNLFQGHAVLSVEEIKSQYKCNNEQSFFYFFHLDEEYQIINGEPFVINEAQMGLGDEVVYNLSRFVPIFTFEVGAGYILYDNFEKNVGRLIITSYYVDGDVIGSSILDYLKDIESGLISGKYTVHTNGYIEM